MRKVFKRDETAHRLGAFRRRLKLVFNLNDYNLKKRLLFYCRIC